MRCLTDQRRTADFGQHIIQDRDGTEIPGRRHASPVGIAQQAEFRRAGGAGQRRDPLPFRVRTNEDCARLGRRIEKGAQGSRVAGGE